MLKHVKNGLLVVLGAIVVLTAFYCYKSTGFLQFSDAAKVGEVARSITRGSGYSSRFILFTNSPQLNDNSLFSARVLPPVSSYLTAMSFKLFGVSDYSVILISAISFVLLVLFTYLLAMRLFGNKVGYVSAIIVATNLSLLSYAITGASETTFILLVLASIYFAVSNNKRNVLISLALMAALYFTRPHAPFYIFAGLFLMSLFITDNLSKAVKIIGGISLVGLGTVLLSFVFDLPFLGIIKERIIVSLAHNSTFAPANDVLRTDQSALLSIIASNIPALVSKLFYNLYNFYKLIPNIFSPYLFVMFVVALFIKTSDKKIRYFRYFVIALSVIVFASTAITAPLYRYLHPLIPFITILGSWALVSISHDLGLKKYALGTIVVFASLGLFVGNVVLDSRFERNLYSYGKPPVYKLLSEQLKASTDETQVIVTNLDTWGSWYGQRKTIWYPLQPEDLKNIKVDVDVIYLTSYLMDDENNYMGDEWRKIFNNPKQINNKYISENYRFVKEVNVSADDNFEKINGRGVILIKK